MARLALALLIAMPVCAQTPPPQGAKSTSDLPALIQSLHKLPFTRTDVTIQPVSEGWEVGMISTLTANDHGTIYLLQRGAKADPIVEFDRHGKVLHSFGAGLFETPHAVRVAPDGNLWTTDSSSSMVQEFTPQGAKILRISVGGQPEGRKGRPAGTTDIAFAGKRVFVSDGYGNARVLEYSAEGKKIGEWGSAGTEPGQFHLPHAITADEQGILYVADRENGRIQRFNLDGKFLGEWDHLGKPMSLHLGLRNTLWVGTNTSSGALTGGYVLEVDRTTGKALGYLEAGDTDIHAFTATPEGDVLVAGKGKVAWFHAAN